MLQLVEVRVADSRAILHDSRPRFSTRFRTPNTAILHDSAESSRIAPILRISSGADSRMILSAILNVILNISSLCTPFNDILIVRLLFSFPVLSQALVVLTLLSRFCSFIRATGCNVALTLVHIVYTFMIFYKASNSTLRPLTFIQNIPKLK